MSPLPPSSIEMQEEKRKDVPPAFVLKCTVRFYWGSPFVILFVILMSLRCFHRDHLYLKGRPFLFKIHANPPIFIRVIFFFFSMPVASIFCSFVRVSSVFFFVVNNFFTHFWFLRFLVHFVFVWSFQVLYERFYFCVLVCSVLPYLVPVWDLFVFFIHI